MWLVIFKIVLRGFDLLNSNALQLAIESRVKRKNVKFDENKPKREAKQKNKIEKVVRRGERRKKRRDEI